MSAGNGAPLPLPGQYLPDFKDPKSPADWNLLLEDIQFKFQAMQTTVGNNSTTTAATALTGLYSGTWADYTGTAGFTPYYGKRAGLVFMGGAVTKSPTTTFPGSAQTMLTLPVGFRPASTEQYAQIAVGGAGGSPTTGIAIVQIAATGVVTFISGVSYAGLTNNMAYISLSGITFGAAA